MAAKLLFFYGLVYNIHIVCRLNFPHLRCPKGFFRNIILFIAFLANGGWIAKMGFICLALACFILLAEPTGAFAVRPYPPSNLDDSQFCVDLCGSQPEVGNSGLS